MVSIVQGSFSPLYRSCVAKLTWTSLYRLSEVWIRLPNLALKPRGDITRSSKQGYQWPTKDLCPLTSFLKRKGLTILLCAVFMVTVALIRLHQPLRVMRTSNEVFLRKKMGAKTFQALPNKVILLFCIKNCEIPSTTKSLNVQYIRKHPRVHPVISVRIQWCTLYY